MGETGDADELAGLVLGSKYTVVLTGAGISTESGLPDFRSPSGLWRQYDPMKVASIWTLRSDPDLFYEFYQKRLAMMEGAQPNAAHFALADLERSGAIKSVITQNIDGLHQAAGSKNVIELHGNLRRSVCLDCRKTYPIDILKQAKVPRCEVCGGLVKPNVVLFGEPLPQDEYDRATTEATRCDLMVAVGSSLEVSPANLLPAIVKARGMKLAIVNLEPTQFDTRADLVIRGKATDVLRTVRDKVGRARRGPTR